MLYSLLLLGIYALYFIDFNYDSTNCASDGCVARPCNGFSCSAGGCLGKGCTAGDCYGEDCIAGDCVGEGCTAGNCYGPGCKPGKCEGKDCTQGAASNELPRSLFFSYCGPVLDAAKAQRAAPGARFFHRYTGLSSAPRGNRIEKDNIILQIDNPLLFTLPFTYRDSQCAYKGL